MTDIVERLKYLGGEVHDLAINEIERLRQRVKELEAKAATAPKPGEKE